jgi:hypothetical protein
MIMPFRCCCVVEFVQRNIDRRVLTDITGTLPHGRHASCATLPPPALSPGSACGLETTAAIVYISLKFLVGMAKSGSTRSRSFLLPADRQRATEIE